MLKETIKRLRLLSLVAFAFAVLILGWQSDDAYHHYIMARHLVEGYGFVYNIGERSNASTCPLFTLIIAAAYFVTHEMFFTSLAVCTLFSTAAYALLSFRFCKSQEQILVSFIALVTCTSFMSYTTSGLENSLLFFLSALFLLTLYGRERYGAKRLLALALILSGLAMTRMDSVLIFVPVIVWAYLFRRENVGVLKMFALGLLGLSPFFLWEVFSLFYFGFPFPNSAYAKLGSGIPIMEYFQRGIHYILITGLNDPVVLIIPSLYFIFSLFARRMRFLLVAAGICVYLYYIIQIGGDFMLGRHFTVIFFISACSIIVLKNTIPNRHIRKTYLRIFYICILCSLAYSLTFGKIIGEQFLYNYNLTQHIADERKHYFKTTGFYNNLLSLSYTGKLCILETWHKVCNTIYDLREHGFAGGIFYEGAFGILVYYNSDLYLNDAIALGDPFLSKLPAIYEPNWRVGHLHRNIPDGYQESIRHNNNEINDSELKVYYEVIRLITRGKLMDQNRIKAIIDINFGKYDHLIHK